MSAAAAVPAISYVSMTEQVITIPNPRTAELLALAMTPLLEVHTRLTGCELRLTRRGMPHTHWLMLTSAITSFTLAVAQVERDQ